MKRMDDDQAQHDGWIDLNLPLGRMYSSTHEELPSARERGVVRPDVLLDIEDRPDVQLGIEGRLVLVGHINELNGLCDDCSMDPSCVVKRYRIVWKAPS